MKVVASRYWKGVVAELWDTFEENELKDVIEEHFEYEGLCEIQELSVDKIELVNTEKDEDGRLFEILADIEFKGVFEVYNDDLNNLLESHGLEPIKFKVILKITMTLRVEIFAVKEDGEWIYDNCYNYEVEEINSIEKEKVEF